MPTLYQQGVKRIEIIVRKDDGAGLQGAKQTETDQVGNETKEYKKTGGRSQRVRRRVITNTMHAVGVAKQLFSLGANYYISGLGDYTGDQALQQQVHRNFEIISDASNFISSTVMGGVYGAWGGPIGSIVGATLGAIQSGASLAVKYMGRERDFNYKVFKENNAIEYRRARASINLTTGRLR